MYAFLLQSKQTTRGNIHLNESASITCIFKTCSVLFSDCINEIRRRSAILLFNQSKNVSHTKINNIYKYTKTYYAYT